MRGRTIPPMEGLLTMNKWVVDLSGRRECRPELRSSLDDIDVNGLMMRALGERIIQSGGEDTAERMASILEKKSLIYRESVMISLEEQLAVSMAILLLRRSHK